ncbi:MAG: hydroxymethylglutaryl-CoA lyase, partial [Taibaiella sp.]|nr:hydroxymethylglutaryl-CoA lyase [Taibaiella sp.]
FSSLVPEFKDVTIGAHFHSTIDKWEEKIATAYNNGCRSFDSAMKGIGGCPMAEDELVGNIATENVVDWAERQQIPLQLDKDAFKAAWLKAAEIFV